MGRKGGRGKRLEKSKDEENYDKKVSLDLDQLSEDELEQCKCESLCI